MTDSCNAVKNVDTILLTEENINMKMYAKRSALHMKKSCSTHSAATPVKNACGTSEAVVHGSSINGFLARLTASPSGKIVSSPASMTSPAFLSLT